MAIHVDTKEQFDNLLNEHANKLIVVDFYATWCGPCKMIAPKLETMAAEHKDKAIFLKVNVDENDELVEQYGISVMPTFIFIKNREKVDVLNGANEDKLREKVAQYLK